MPSGRLVEPGIWLLDLDIAGQTHRLATEAVEVTTAAGETIAYREGLAEPSVGMSAAADAGPASIALEITTDTDWALLVSQGHSLDQRPAALRRYYSGRTLERGRVVLRGRTSQPSFGARYEPLRLSLTRDVASTAAVIPDPQAVVDASTWPVTGGATLPSSADGAYYPVVIGCPGHTGGTPVPCVPVPQAEFQAGLGVPKNVWLGGHASQVRLRTLSAGVTTDSDVTPSVFGDLLGRDVDYVLNSASDTDVQAWVGFQDDASYGGGLYFEGVLLRGAGDVVSWVLRTCDHTIDWARIEATRAYLNNYKIDTYINAPVNLWDWLQAEVLPMLPVELREGPAGLYLAVYRWDAREKDAVAHLDATLGSGRVTRDGSASYVGDPVNEITVDYRPGAESGARWLDRRVVTAQYGSVDIALTEDPRIVPHRIASESRARYGPRPVRLQLSATWDTDTAVRVGLDTLLRAGLPKLAIRYVGGPWLEDLEVGAVVLVTDPELYLSAAVALVVEVTPGSDTAVDVLLLG